MGSTSSEPKLARVLVNKGRRRPPDVTSTEEERVSRPWPQRGRLTPFLPFLCFGGLLFFCNALSKGSRRGSPLENSSWFEGGLSKQMVTTPINPLCLQPAESICLLAVELPTSKGKLIRHRQTLRQSHLVNVSVFLSFGKSLSCL